MILGELDAIWTDCSALLAQEMSYRREASTKKSAGALDPERVEAETARPVAYRAVAEKIKVEQRGGGECRRSLKSGE